MVMVQFLHKPSLSYEKKKMGKKSKKQKDSGKRSATPPEGKELSKICSRQPATGAKEFEEYVEIYNMVEKIRQIQSGISSPPAPRGDNLATFQEWLTNNGVDCNVVEIAEFPGYGMGLKTKKDLQEADAILSVPRKVMITTMTARDSPLGPLIAEDKILQAMPNKYTTPLYFTPEEIQLLKGSPSQSSCMTHYRNITRQYAYFYRLLQNNPAASKLPIKDHFTYDDYRWAVSTVSTRQNPIPSKDGSKTLFGLIPLLDMCNHCNGTISLDFCLEKDCSDCFAMREFKEGEQIFIFYGARSNSEFLVHNGFVYPENELDRLPVKLGISKSDPLCELKTELLSQLGLPASRTFQIHTGQNPIDPHLLAFLRVFSMEEEKLREFLSQPLTEEAKENFGDEEHPVSPDNEEKVWKFLETRVSLLQRAYETSIQDDEEELKKSELSEHCRLLIQLRLCEKKILQSTLEYAKNIKQTYSEQQDGAS
ncbi:hypothetical protein KUTeg_014101 [Tegillarca granosa]|uniref:protein-histidine N-methyltransferase n=1 Tax=Tegillarca granosa TaxID=220873 RepID=A0ABQ9EZ44_TEGGR|nr:hypothetical protein KUTeg_014101 [Tegillarca granosa]